MPYPPTLCLELLPKQFSPAEIIIIYTGEWMMSVLWWENLCDVYPRVDSMPIHFVMHNII